MTALYYFHSSSNSQRVRLALGYKQLAWDDRPVAYADDETFFELGVARHVPVLRLDEGRLLTDSREILRSVDELFPGTPPLVTGRIDAAAWQALMEWRERVDPILERLRAPALPAYAEIGAEPDTLAAYKAEVQHRFGMSVEELANDRYSGYAQFERITRPNALAKHLARSGFYMGEPSIADLVLAADLYILQVLDGISLPLDLLYYFERVQDTCNIRLSDDLLVSV